MKERDKLTFDEWLKTRTGPEYIRGLPTADKLAKAAFEFHEKELAESQVREKALRDALEKIADWYSSWGPYPETNAGWRAMAIVTAREAVPLNQPTDDIALKAKLKALWDALEKPAEAQAREIKWVSSEDYLPEIADGNTMSQSVLCGCWITDNWFREDSPYHRSFVFGSCTVIRDDNMKEFPMGFRWLTFGPSHNQISHWAYVTPPNSDQDVLQTNSKYEACLAHNALLRDALSEINVELLDWEGKAFYKMRDVLAIPTDDTALKAMLKVERERCADECIAKNDNGDHKHRTRDDCRDAIMELGDARLVQNNHATEGK